VRNPDRAARGTGEKGEPVFYRERPFP